MRAYTFSIDIDRSSEIVWQFLTDLSQTPKWRTMMRSMEVVGGGPLQQNCSLRIVMEANGKVGERTILTTVFDAPRRWVTHSESNGVSGDFEYVVSAADHGRARLTMSCDLQAHRLLAWIFLPIIARQERRVRVDQLEKFKRACEAATSRSRA